MKWRHYAAPPAPLMGEDVLGAPAAEIEQRPARQEVEAGLRQGGAALARQHFVEPVFQGMEMQHVGGGVAELLVAELGCAPIRGLLLLRQLDAEKVAAEILEPVPIGEGAGESRGDLGAVD